MTLILQIIIKDRDRYTSEKELLHRINKSLSECLIRWTLEECLHENPYVKE